MKPLKLIKETLFGRILLSKQQLLQIINYKIKGAIVVIGRAAAPYRDLSFCGECGAMVAAEEKVKRQKNENIHHYVYYHCTKRRNPHCSQKVVEEKN